MNDICGAPQTGRTAGALDELKATLLALADRCEQEKASRELDADVAIALGHKIEWKAAKYATEMYPAIHWQEPSAGMRKSCPKWTESIDAAVTLVPTGWNWMLDGAANAAGVAQDDDLKEGDAMTPALALCAAALRARAQEIE